MPVSGYAIYGSGPLAIRGIIPLNNDLDVICGQAVWDLVSAMGDVQHLPDYDVDIVSMADGALTFGTKWGIGDFDIDEMIATAELIDGLPFVRLKYIVAYKTIRASGKDLAHLRALEQAGLADDLS